MTPFWSSVEPLVYWMYVVFSLSPAGRGKSPAAERSGATMRISPVVPSPPAVSMASSSGPTTTALAPDPETSVRR